MNIVIILIIVLACLVIVIFSPAINFKFLLLLIRPFRRYERLKEPPQPDYSDPANWAALPGKESITDQVPLKSMMQETKDDKPADVFYIHRTTLLSGLRWNAVVQSKGLNRLTDKQAIRNQAGIFNASCKIYAPRYRQATLYSFFDRAGSGQKALDLAYSDVKNAFRYYLEHYHNGRPIVLAAHSQGAEHATRLIHDFFDGKEMADKLVVAYLVGMPVQKDAFRGISPSGSEIQNKCFVSWSTFGWGIKPNYFKEQYKTAVCTNPLTWNKDEEYGDFTSHLGSVRPNYKMIDKNVIAAKCSNGVLWIKNRKVLTYMPLPLKNYVVMDLDLFYMNIRENVKKRINNYLGSVR